MAFGTYPSDLHRRIFWEASFEDIKVKVKLYMGQTQAGFVQEFETLSKIISLAFGGPSKKKAAVDENTVVPQSGAELRKAFNKVFG